MLPTRKIPRSCTDEEIWNDVPAKIATAMGGQQFFFDEEARAIHRVGIGLGLGWRLPKYKQRADRINHVTVSLFRGLLKMEFLHSTENPEDGSECIRAFYGLQYADLRNIYEITMYGDDTSVS